MDVNIDNKALAKKYKNISQRDHVLLRPGMYLGNINTVEKQTYVYEDDGKINSKVLPYNEGLVKIVNEAVDNAIDNVFRSTSEYLKQTSIKVNIKDDVVSVTNDGQHIPIETNDKGEYIPSVIFGKCLSGSNYDDESGRKSIGLNGLGVKLANICSTHFEVFIIDPIASKTFSQTWTDNMGTISEPIIKKATKKQLKSDVRTKVIFKPDIEKFNVQSLNEVVPFIHMRMIEVSSTLKENIKLYFNNNRIKVGNFKSFVHLFAERRSIYFDNVFTNVNMMEYGFKVSDDSDGFQQHSFVNNTRTTDGGPHVDAVSDTICRVIQKYFKSKTKDQIVRLSKSNILAKLHVFVSYHMVNPQFTSQTKTKLASKLEKIQFDENKILKSCKKLGILKEIEDKLNERALEYIEKSCSSVKKKTLNIPKLDDAHYAGTSKSNETMLFLTEGDSAKTFCSTGLSVLKRQKYGVFPLKGKILNVRSASKKQLLENKEVQNIIKILGLSLSKKYTSEDELKSLRYGKVCILSDADYDGFHIAGLFFNFIMHFWPVLAKSGFICRFITPVLKAMHKKNRGKVISFFNVSDFENFASRNNIDQYNVKYFKGLGTSTRNEAIEYFNHLDLHLKQVVLDDDSFSKCDVMFNPRRSNERKTLIVENDCQLMDYKLSDMAMTAFFDSEFLSYSKYSIQRAIPSIMDGLKVSQRKILFTCLKKFSTHNAEYKVSQLASLVSAQTAYLHGEQSLSNAIVCMAQSFPGSNNLPLLSENGSFGSRLQNGKDCASSRYIFTNLRDYTRDIFVKEDDAILTYKTEEGISIEPEYYFPTIPLVLCNGTNGISTGFRTEIPMYDVKEIINSIIMKCETHGSYDFDNLLPKYYGFKGSVRPDESGGKLIMSGCYEIDAHSKTCVITEIPLNFSLESYKDKVLDRLVELGHISSYKVDHTSENEPRFVLKNLKDSFKPDLLRLDSILNNHMVLLDSENRVKIYTGTRHIMEEFFENKIRSMKRRRTCLIEKTESSLQFLRQKQAFIRMVLSNEIDIKSDIEDVEIQCSLVGILTRNIEKFINLPIVALTSDKVEELKNAIIGKINELELIQSKSAYDFYLEDLKRLKKSISPREKRKIFEAKISSSKKSRKV